MNTQQVIKDLKTLISFRSISTDPTYKLELLKAATFLKQRLSELGCEVFMQEKGDAPPLIIAQKVISSDAKTIAIYGHYDVQPEDPRDEWNAEPFTLTIGNGKMFARGVADNKGHIVQNITAIENLITSQSLKNNIIFIFEGEEESGSEHFETLISSAQNLLKEVDVFYITDTGMRARNIPIIYYSLRGYVGFEVTLTIGERDLHSGVYGNQVYNPAQLMANILAKMKDVHTGQILIPGFNNDVRTLDKTELDLLEKSAVTEDELKKDTQTHNVLSYEGKPTHLLAKIYPAMDIGGMSSGYTGTGIKNIIPKSATAKFSFRLVEHQDPLIIKKIIEKFIEQQIPAGVQYQIKNFAADAPFYTDINNEYMQKTARILTHHFGNETLFDREGASIPAAEILQRIFNKPIILTGFVLPGENMHAPNENYDEEMFWKGIGALEKIYAEI